MKQDISALDSIVSASKIDLSFRPETYWPDSLNREQLLSRIKGQSRRNQARQTLAADGFTALDPTLTQSDLNESERSVWGRLHPTNMGGEYLPTMAVNTVEIARMSLDSTTSDQVSIRAHRLSKRIRYSIVDEYEREHEGFHLARKTSRQPLMLGELIAFLEKSHWPDRPADDGLIQPTWKSQLDSGDSAKEAVDFIQIESAYYSELTVYYECLADQWVTEHG